MTQIKKFHPRTEAWHGREQIHDVEKDYSFRNGLVRRWIRVPRCIHDLDPLALHISRAMFLYGTRCTYHRDRVQCSVLRSVRHNHIVPPTCGRRRNPTFRPCLVSGRTIRQSPNTLYRMRYDIPDPLGFHVVPF